MMFAISASIAFVAVITAGVGFALIATSAFIAAGIASAIITAVTGNAGGVVSAVIAIITRITDIAVVMAAAGAAVHVFIAAVIFTRIAAI